MVSVLRMNRFVCVVTTALVIVLLIGCGGAEDDTTRSPFWDTSGDVRGAEVAQNWETRDLPGLLKIYDAAAVVEVTDITEVKRQVAPENPIVAEDPADQAELDRNTRNFLATPERTTYLAKVGEWIQGSGPDEVSIVGGGGLADIEGPDGTVSRNQTIFPDGMFLLEPGRTYLLLLDKTEAGAFEYGPAFSAFDLTGGVHVLNHPLTRDIESYEEMSVDDFVAYVRGLAAAAKSD